MAKPRPRPYVGITGFMKDTEIANVYNIKNLLTMF